MPTITFVTNAGERGAFQFRIGQSLMECAVANGVSGILAECGGACMCATCHVYVDALLDCLPTMSDAENEMLNECVSKRRANSRLACQIRMTEILDGIVVRIAENR